MIVKLHGAEDLERALKRVTDAVKYQALDKTLEAAGEYVRQDAHDKCAVKGGVSADGFYRSESEPSGRPGAVRESIKYRLSQFKPEVYVLTNHIIAPDLEFGTSREQAKPFMRRSADDPQTQLGVVEIFNRVMRQEIEGAIW